MKYSKDQLEQAIIDLLDGGNSSPQIIAGDTGLPMARCEQLSKMYNDLVMAREKTRHKLSADPAP